MCRACGSLCCASNTETGCGCDYCFHPDCWPAAAKVGPGLVDEDAMADMSEVNFENSDGPLALNFNDA